MRQNTHVASYAQARINQVGTFSVDAIKQNHQSPTSNLLSFIPNIYNS